MIEHLPTVNACLNGLCTILLVAGFVAIKRGRREGHKRFMLAALVVSALFLAGYLTYHYVHGDTKYVKHDWTRAPYFVILITHIVLAAVMVPLVILTVVRALKSNFEKHRRIARITLPIWLYVSITGVVIYGMLYTFGGRG